MPKSETCIAILQATFNKGGQETPEFKSYSLRSNANGEANGGKLLAKYKVTENLGQGETPHMVFVIEFPSKAVAQATFTNEEYRSIIPLRDVAFKEVKILLSDAL